MATARPILCSVLLHGSLVVGLAIGGGSGGKHAARTPLLVTFTHAEARPAAAPGIEMPVLVAEPECEPDVIVREALDEPVLPPEPAPPPVPPERTPPTPLSARLAAQRIRNVEPPPPAQVAAAPHAHVLTPVPGTNQPPDYPAAARRRGWQGTVVIAFECDEKGLVLAAAVRVSSGHAILDAAALAAVRSWRFHGGPGSSEQPIEFRLGA